MIVSSKLYEMPELQEINRLPMHGAEIPFANEEQAFERKYEKSPYYRSLNGKWEFSLYRKPEDVPSEILSPAFRFENRISVPGHWPSDSVAPPIYTNVQMPAHFPEPPCVPEDNPTGVYRKIFSLPAAWKNRRVILHVGGAESYLEVYLNGSFVGMGKDTRLESEFDLTPFLCAGKNQLVCKVIRWSDSSFIEDQDQWWLSGIYRNVYLYSVNYAFIEDLFVNGDWDHRNGRGEIFCRLHGGFDVPHYLPRGPETDFDVEYMLLDKEQKCVWQDKAVLSHLFRDNGYVVEKKAVLPGISPWSAEDPVLYTLLVKLVDSNGKTVDIRSKRVGFRNIKVEGCDLLFNGKRVFIRGVNRHEHSMTGGKVLSREEMLTDIRLMKQFNFNAVRTCHYPDTPEWYDLCDEYGIYVLDEADVECHAYYPRLCREMRWQNAFVTRGVRMVLRDRSHACIFGWSSGNESGNGENHEAQIDAMRKLDDTRIIHHEGECKTLWYQGDNQLTGGRKERNAFWDAMYAHFDVLKAYSATGPERPAILCEYAHAMGNSSGSLGDYWDLFYTLPGLQGGFIWDWIDQGLLEKRNGKEMLCYGGDFGEERHDFDFCCNGMIAADRRIHPGMYEFRHVVQPVKVTALDDKSSVFVIRNMRNFTTLSDLAGVWQLQIDGKIIKSGNITGLDELLPEETLTVALELPRNLPGKRAFVNFAFTSKQANAWSEAGTLFAHDQIEVTERLALSLPEHIVEHTVPVLEKTRNTFVLTNSSCRLAVDCKSGTGSLEVNGKKVVKKLFSENLFRAGIDNDGIRGRVQSFKPLYQWLEAGLDDLHTASVRVSSGGKSDPFIKIVRKLYGKDPRKLITFTQKITALKDGSFGFEQNVDLPRVFPTMPRIGVVAVLAPGFEQLSYFGRGPWENYSDRNRSAQFGLYQTAVSDMYEDTYILPQENGNRSDVSQLKLVSDDCEIEVSSDTAFEFGASHFTVSDLWKARHQCELKARKETYLFIDHAQRGLGTGSCGPQTLPQYCLDEKEYSFSFKLNVKKL